jgi:predicted dehydrogenase
VTSPSIGVAVIGAGMAGRAHAAGYRSATTLYDAGLPEVRLVAIADVNATFAADTARRFGYQRTEPGWEAVAAAPDIDVVSVVVANPLHRRIVEGLLAAGKHVLCEKPMAPSVEDGAAMVEAAKAAGRQAAVGFTFRRSPAVAAVRDRVEGGGIGRPLHFNGHYWCDYGCDPNAPMSWRYKGGPGSGALSDIGSHLLDLAEFLCGPIRSVRGAVLSTVIGERPLPLGTAVGHAAVAVGEEREPVENEDLVTLTATFASGATGTVLRLVIDYHRTYDLVCRHATQGMGSTAGHPLPDGVEVVPGRQAPGSRAPDALGHDLGPACRPGHTIRGWRAWVVCPGVLP